MREEEEGAAGGVAMLDTPPLSCLMLNLGEMTQPLGQNHTVMKEGGVEKRHKMSHRDNMSQHGKRGCMK
jgi:hypothetical protein